MPSLSSKLKIGIDACPLTRRSTGIGRYVIEICKALDKIMPETEFLLYSPRPLTVEPPSDRWHSRVGGIRRASSYVWLKMSAGAMAETDSVHTFWATRTILPGHTGAFRTISTVHDLNYRLLPNSMPLATLWAHRLWFARDVHRADSVVTNSQGTATRIYKTLGVRADAVALPGVSAAFGSHAAEENASRLAALKVNQPYFLAVGTLEPRKNLVALMEAFVALKKSQEIRNHTLLIAGNRGWRDRRLRALLNEAERQGVHWLGFVSDDDLAALYAGATAFVFPSLYEGFGIPAAEARACGARVVASDLPELREAAGSMGIYIEPSVAGICQGLLRAVREPPLDQSEEATPSWEEAANMMARIFQRTCLGTTDAQDR